MLVIERKRIQPIYYIYAGVGIAVFSVTLGMLFILHPTFGDDHSAVIPGNISVDTSHNTSGYITSTSQPSDDSATPAVATSSTAQPQVHTTKTANKSTSTTSTPATSASVPTETTAPSTDTSTTTDPSTPPGASTPIGGNTKPVDTPTDPTLPPADPAPTE